MPNHFCPTPSGSHLSIRSRLLNRFIHFLASMCGKERKCWPFDNNIFVLLLTSWRLFQIGQWFNIGNLGPVGNIIHSVGTFGPIGSWSNIKYMAQTGIFDRKKNKVFSSYVKLQNQFELIYDTGSLPKFVRLSVWPSFFAAPDPSIHPVRKFLPRLISPSIQFCHTCSVCPSILAATDQ